MSTLNFNRMNRMVRHSVFETNSSSCHSLALAKDGNGKLSKMYTDYHLNNGDLVFSTGEYGWEFNILSTFGEKLDYIMTYVLLYDGGCYFNTVIQALHDVTQFERLYYHDDLVGHWNNETDEFEFVDHEDVYSLHDRAKSLDGYIDHESVGLLDSILRDENKLKNLLFVKDSVIYTENDNHLCHVAGGSYDDVCKQVKNLLMLSLPKSKTSKITDDVVEQFIKTFGHLCLAGMISELDQSGNHNDRRIIAHSLMQQFSRTYGDAGNLNDLFRLVRSIHGARFKRLKEVEKLTVEKLTSPIDSYSIRELADHLPSFAEYLFEQFKDEVFDTKESNRRYYSDLDIEMRDLKINDCSQFTYQNMVGNKEYKSCFEHWIDWHSNSDTYVNYYLTGYLLLDKMKMLPLKKWTDQFSYSYE